MLNIHHLELFFYVARHGGISAALPHLPWGVQQPAVSSQLIRLEESLGVKLFDRRPFALTPAGEEVFEAIAPFFSQLPHLASKIRGQASRHLRLGAASSGLRDHLPGLVRSLREEIPDLRLTLREVRQDAAERLLREHEIDVAITPLERLPDTAIRHQPLLELPMVLLAGPGWNFATAREVLAHPDLAELPLIALPPHEQLTRVFEGELTKRGQHWPVQIEASSLDVVNTCVAEGLGLGLAVDVPGMQRDPAIRRLPLPDFPPLIIAAFWQTKPAPLTQRFLELAESIARSLAAQRKTSERSS